MPRDDKYSGIAEATHDVRTKVNESELINHPLSSPTFAVLVPAWTDALSGFDAKTTVSPRDAVRIQQVESIYETEERWLIETAERLDIRTLNEHDPEKVLFMGLFRDLQIRYASKQNLNPHKLTVLLDDRYTIDE